MSHTICHEVFNSDTQKLKIIYFRQIISIDLVNGLFKVKYDIKRSWYDPGVGYLHLNEKKPNFVNAENLKNIWTPNLVFFNIESKERIEESDKKAIAQIKPNPSFVFKATDKANK